MNTRLSRKLAACNREFYEEPRIVRALYAKKLYMREGVGGGRGGG